MFCLSLKKKSKAQDGAKNQQPEKKMPPTFEEEKFEVQKEEEEPVAQEESDCDVDISVSDIE